MHRPGLRRRTSFVALESARSLIGRCIVAHAAPFVHQDALSIAHEYRANGHVYGRTNNGALHRAAPIFAAAALRE